jgi:X-X-X-Leu-X-X-Gly heptad repeat protein
MYMKKWMKATTSLAMIIVFTGSVIFQTAVTSVQSKGAAQVQKAPETARLSGGKDEVVYVNLLSSGQVNDIYVVNQFEAASAGNMVDYGDYTEVKNLTTTETLTQDGDAVTLPLTQGNFYYQGTLNQSNLPWIFNIEYFLNGMKMGAEEVAGQNGNLEIRLTSRQNEAVDPSFYEQYMLQISLTLDTERCANIISNGATIASAGKNKVIAHTIMPGKAADITVNATVQNFTMPSIEIAGMPFSSPVEIPDTNEMLDNMTTLTDAIAALNDGVGDLQTGVENLNNGVGDLVSGSSNYASGLSALSGNSGRLTSGSEKINSALTAIAKSLNASDDDSGKNLGEITQLPVGLRQMSTGLKQIAAGLTQLKDGYSSMFSMLDSSILAIPSVADSDIMLLSTAVAMMDDADPNKAATQLALDNMLAAYGSAQTVKGTYITIDPKTGISVQRGMAAVSSSLETIVKGDGTASNPGLSGMVASLNTLADEIESALDSTDMLEQIQQLGQGLATLSKEYENFHTGLVEYTNGVTQLASGYDELHKGLVKLEEGTNELNGGTQALYEGTTELKEETDSLPDTIQVEIDKLMEDYDKGEYVPISFTSPQNTNINSVQFVIMTTPIELPEEPQITDIQVEEATLWDRFLDLFR